MSVKERWTVDLGLYIGVAYAKSPLLGLWVTP